MTTANKVRPYYGWYSERDLTHQCSDCYWVLKEHRLACCEFDKPEFPKAQKCEKHDIDGVEAA